MSKVCEITGKKVVSGNRVSHAMNHTKRTFQPNLHRKKYYVPSEDKFVTIRVSAAGMRTIDKLGIQEALKRAKDKGFFKG